MWRKTPTNPKWWGINWGSPAFFLLWALKRKAQVTYFDHNLSIVNLSTVRLLTFSDCYETRYRRSTHGPLLVLLFLFRLTQECIWDKISNGGFPSSWKQFIVSSPVRLTILRLNTLTNTPMRAWGVGSRVWVELNLLFNVTINDISVIYVTAHRCAGGLKKKLDLRSGSQRHRHFAGFFNVPVLAPTRDHPFYTVIPTHRPI